MHLQHLGLVTYGIQGIHSLLQAAQALHLGGLDAALCSCVAPEHLAQGQVESCVTTLGDEQGHGLGGLGAQVPGPPGTLPTPHTHIHQVHDVPQVVVADGGIDTGQA